MNIITGEKIQQICDIYIGKDESFNFNPLIQKQFDKHFNIDLLNREIDNPFYIFCYSHYIDELSSKINYFKNKFVLVSHNSDQNIEQTEQVKNILNCNNLIKWYSQNISFQHNKLHLLPIGLANSQWEHGNLTIFNDINLMNNLSNKSKYIYFNFSITTNVNKRQPCYNILKDKLDWLENINPVLNLYRLKEYKFCICPQGNGLDTHRLWECLYLRVVPIVLNSEFTQILLKYNIPLVILNDWNELLEMNLEYEKYNFDDKLFNSILNFNSLIEIIKS